MDATRAALDQVLAGLHGLGLPDSAVTAIVASVQQHLRITPQAPRALPKPMTPAEIARSFRRSSIRRTEVFGQRVGGGSAWNMMLELFACHHEDRRVSVSSLCYASGGANTTALRQLDLMLASGLVERAEDPCDGRRTWIAPTPRAIEGMTYLIESFRLTASQPLVSPPRS